MEQTIIGTRLRERRRQMGVTQAEMARRLEISASYLNLIERNKRRITDALLQRAARELDISLDTLTGAGEKRLLDSLETIARRPSLRSLGLEETAVSDLLARYPGWARAIETLARSEDMAQETTRALSEQMTHDPFLGEAVHSMLTRVAAVRSASEILQDFPDVSQEERERFTRIVNEEATILTEVGEALSSYFEKSVSWERSLTPNDEVEALFAAHENRFEEIDEAAENLGNQIEPGPPTQLWIAARGLAAAVLPPVVNRILSESKELETELGRSRADRALLDYAAAAILVPYKRFTAQAVMFRYDAEALAQAFNTDFWVICQRLTALAAPEHPSFGYLRANAAGSLTNALLIKDLTLPRYGLGCPLWVLFRAAREPFVIQPQTVIFPSGVSFQFLARARLVGSIRFDRPRHHVTDMLVLSVGDAQRTVYSQSVLQQADEVGAGCRLCPRRACEHRVEDPLLS